MVRTYKRVTERRSWNLETVQIAVDAVKNSELSIREASAVYGIPKSTLERHKNNKIQTPGCLGRFRPVLNVEFEKELADYCVEMQNRLFGLTVRDLRSMAFQLAERNHLDHGFDTEKQLAGKDWVAGFLRRNPELSLRMPEPTSIGRAVGFNTVQVGRFYDLLENAYRDHGFDRAHVWNVDETGLSCVHTPGKIIGKKGQRQIGKITSGERGKTVTAVCAYNAEGMFIPPMLIFPRIKMNQRLIHDAPLGTIGAASKSGWIDSSLFLQWFEHFVKRVKPSTNDQHLILLDGHISHKSLPLIEAARSNGVTLLCFPPHTTHALQPLDCVFFGPLKKFYNQACEAFMLHNPGKRITDYDIASLFKNAYSSAASLDKGETGFQSTGIYPLDRNAIPEYRYVASLTTDCNTSVMDEVNDRQSTAVVRTIVFGANCAVDDIIFDPPDVGEEIVVEIHGEAVGSTDHAHSTGDASAFEIPLCAGHTAENHILAHSAVEDSAVLHREEPTADISADHCYAGVEISCSSSDVDNSSSPVSMALPADDFPTTSDSVAMLPVPSYTDGEQILTPSSQTKSSPQLSTKRVRAVDISPYPKCIRSENRRRKSHKAEILTSSPYKNLMQSKELEQEQRRPKRGRKRKYNEKMQAEAGVQKRGKKLDKGKKTGSNKEMEQEAVCRKKRNKRNQEKKNTYYDRTDSDDHTPCACCGKCFNTPQDDKLEDDWLSCVSCNKWLHETCAEQSGIIDDDGAFVCKHCVH